MRNVFQKFVRWMRWPGLSQLKRGVQGVVYGAVDGMVAMSGMPHARSGVLIVRLDNIGDFMMWQRTASRLRALYPGQRVVLAANSKWASLAKQLPYWDEVILIDVRRLKIDLLYRWRTYHGIRRRGFAVALQPTYSRIHFLGDTVVRVSGATERIGADGDLNNTTDAEKRVADRWYTRLVDAGGPDLTEMEHNETFLRALGGEGVTDPQYRFPRVASLPTELQFDRPYFIVFPGASWTGRMWPEESFGRVIDALCDAHDWLPVLCGSADEVELCQEVAARSGRNVINLAGRTSLAEFCEVVRSAELLVGNDTSAVHISAAVGTRSVCIFGGGHFGRFLPYPANAGGVVPEVVYERMPCFGCGFNCYMPHDKSKALPCVAGVSVRAVIEAAERIAGVHDRGRTV